jgi:hypothetical protein
VRLSGRAPDRIIWEILDRKGNVLRVWHGQYLLRDGTGRVASTG